MVNNNLDDEFSEEQLIKLDMMYNEVNDFLKKDFLQDSYHGQLL